MPGHLFLEIGQKWGMGFNPYVIEGEKNWNYAK